MTRIPLSKIVSDWPVDHSHVLHLRESMRVDGQLEPITVWRDSGDMYQVANGAHRLAAATELKWKDIEANILVGDEEQFWDARIMASKQHEAVANDRLVAWMLSAWRTSKWYQDAMTAQDEAREMAEAIWAVELSAPTRERWEPIARDTLRPAEQELLSWFVKKAIKWGRNFSDLRTVVFTYMGWPMSEKADAMAREQKLSLDERNALAKEMRRNGKSGPRKTRQPRTPQEKVRATRTAILAASDRLSDTIEQNKATLVSMEDGMLLVVSCMSHLQQTMERLWPDATSEKRVNEAYIENVTLREKVHALEMELEAMNKLRKRERATRTRQVAAAAMALPSSVIEEKTRA